MVPSGVQTFEAAGSFFVAFAAAGAADVGALRFGAIWVRGGESTTTPFPLGRDLPL